MSSVRLYRPRKMHLLNSNLGTIIRGVRISMGTFKGTARDGSAPKRPTLLRLLEIYRFTESGDIRDKVYAFVGLSAEQEMNPLKVDYELKGEEVFVEAARHVLDSMGNLNLLSLKKNDFGTELTLKLPSWVPDFNVQDLMPSINHYALFSASEGLGNVGLSYLPGDRLQLSGVKIDRVRDVGVPFRWAVNPELSLLLEKVTPVEGQTIFETLWRTLLWDSFEEKTPAPKDCGNSFLEVLEQKVLRLQVVAMFHRRYAEDPLRLRAQSAALSGEFPEGFDLLMGFEQVREQLGIMYTAFQRILERRTEEDGVIFPPDFIDFENRLSESKSEAESDLMIEKFHDELSNRLALARGGGDFQFQVSGRAALLPFVTERGFLGMGPRTLEVGDEV